MWRGRHGRCRLEADDEHITLGGIQRFIVIPPHEVVCLKERRAESVVVRGEE
jgi:hypothetical protein